MVEDFSDRVAKYDRINEKFAKSDLVRLRQMLIDQVCEAAGGPCKYTGRSMKEAHEGMRVTSGEFDALAQDLVATLNHFKVGKKEQDEILGVLGPLKTDIVEVDSSQAGTASGHVPTCSGAHEVDVAFRTDPELAGKKIVR